MNNHQDGAFDSPSRYQPLLQPPPRIDQKVISTLALLALGYYVLNFFDAWPSTLKRASFEWGVWAVPSHLIYVLEHLVHKFGREPFSEPLFKREDFGDFQAKAAALRRIIGGANNPVRGVMRRARTMSGLDNVFPYAENPRAPGLGNWDNSCYQNSVLQGFASLPAFASFIRQSNQSLPPGGRREPTHGALGDLFDILHDLSGRYKTVWTPSPLKSMNSWQQQDAQEYFSKVLDSVENETKKLQQQLEDKPGLEIIRKRKFERFASSTDSISGSTDEDTDSTDAQSPPADTHYSKYPESRVAIPKRPFSKPQTLVKNPLNGMLAQAVICQTCGFSDGLQFTPFNCLTVNMGEGGGATLEDLLEEFTDPEDIEGVECENCTRLAQAEADAEQGGMEPSDSAAQNVTARARIKPVRRTKRKQITIGRLPTDLVIHINRSIFDNFGNRYKNHAAAKVPNKLRILDEWCAPLQEKRDMECVYELRCAVVHFGRHEDGHYIAYGKRDKEWYRFNDNAVSRVDLDEVLSVQNAFMLFYEAIGDIPRLENKVTPDLVPSVVKNGLLDEQARSKGGGAKAVVETLVLAEGAAAEAIPPLPETSAPAEILPIDPDLLDPALSDSAPDPALLDPASLAPEPPASIIQTHQTNTSDAPPPSTEIVSEGANTDGDDATSVSTSTLTESEEGEEGHVPTAETEMTLPAMRTAPPSNQVKPHANFMAANIVRAVQ